VLLLAANFVIVPFGSVTQALLSRDMRFGALGVVSVGYSLTNTAVAITLAWLGGSYMALAWASVAAAVVSALLSNIYRPKNLSWIPGLREVGRIVSFGGRASVNAVLSEISTGIPDLAVGRLQGMEAAGLYGRAYGLVALFQNGVMRAVWPVMLPYFSSAQRTEGQLKSHYVRSILLITGVGWPFMVFTGLMAYPIIRLMFGTQWDAAVDPARLLCTAGAVTLMASFSGHVLLAMGLLTRLIRFQMAMLPAKLAIVIAGALYGLEWLAAALIAWSLVMAVWSHLVLRGPVGVRMSDYAPVVLKSGVAALATGIPSAALLFIFGARPTDSLTVLMVGIVVSGLAYFVALFAIRHPLADEMGKLWLRVVSRRIARGKR
jgi:O-antigen/teichoic acid export membrane protein